MKKQEINNSFWYGVCIAFTKIREGIKSRLMSKYRDKDVEEFAEMIKALSNPTRLRIFLRPVSCVARTYRFLEAASAPAAGAQ